MGYLHIQNLYKEQDILLFRECYAMEKIHGTSAHIKFESNLKNPKITFFSGGEKHEKFVELFDIEILSEKFQEHVDSGVDVIIYGEAYGGKCQGMSDTYGKSLKFIVFDVQIGDCWLSVPQAENVANKLGLDFVWWTKTDTNLEELNKLRDAPSVQAVRNGMGNDKKSEGVVLRPLIEVTKNNGNRVICKHKRDDFRETKTSREVDPARQQILTEANEVADEWVTKMRLEHVIDKLPFELDVTNIGKIIPAMIEDV